jgi:hypothetical protein
MDCAEWAPKGWSILLGRLQTCERALDLVLDAWLCTVAVACCWSAYRSMTAESRGRSACAAERALCYVGVLWCLCVPAWILRVCGVLLVTQVLWFLPAQQLWSRAKVAASSSCSSRDVAAIVVECAAVGLMAWMAWMLA